jgi:hypothetical protein
LKPGLYAIALELPEAELVPVYLQNLSRILPKGEFLPVLLVASTTIGAPICLEPTEGRRTFLERARQAMVSLAPSHERLVGPGIPRPDGGHCRHADPEQCRRVGAGAAGDRQGSPLVVANLNDRILAW